MPFSTHARSGRCFYTYICDRVFTLGRNLYCLVPEFSFSTLCQNGGRCTMEWHLSSIYFSSTIPRIPRPDFSISIFEKCILCVILFYSSYSSYSRMLSHLASICYLSIRIISQVENFQFEASVKISSELPSWKILNFVQVLFCHYAWTECSYAWPHILFSIALIAWHLSSIYFLWIPIISSARKLKFDPVSILQQLPSTSIALEKYFYYLFMQKNVMTLWCKVMYENDVRKRKQNVIKNLCIKTFSNV